MIKKIILICIFSLMLISNIFALTSDEILKYKGKNVTIVQKSSVLPYTIRGTIIDIVINNERDFLMLQTNNYRDYTNGIAFISIDTIIKIIE